MLDNEAELGDEGNKAKGEAILASLRQGYIDAKVASKSVVVSHEIEIIDDVEFLYRSYTNGDEESGDVTTTRLRSRYERE